MRNHSVRNENIVLYRKLITEAKNDPNRDETRYQTLKRLLANEEAKDGPPDDTSADA